MLNPAHLPARNNLRLLACCRLDSSFDRRGQKPARKTIGHVTRLDR
jgi:hypothetical protein